jgi:hypothetical protein
MNLISVIADRWLGLCPKTSALRTGPAALMVAPDTIHPAQPDGSGPAARPGQVRQGVSIAAESLKTMIRDRQMLWFSLISGLLMIFLFALLYWTRGHVYYDPFLIKIRLGDLILWFDPRFIPILAFCLFCFTFLMAGLIQYRSANRPDHPLTIRKGFAGARAHAGPLASLSIAMAIAGTILFVIASNENWDFTTNVIFPLMDTFMPYLWFIPNQLEVMITISFFGTILFINIILLMVLLYVVPVIVLENKSLVPALAGSVTIIRKTWREMLGCLFVYGTLLLMVGVISLVISQSFLHYNHDPKFVYNQGLMPVMSVFSGFILFGITILMAVCSTAAGVAIAELYQIGTSNGMPGIPVENAKIPEPAL